MEPYLAASLRHYCHVHLEHTPEIRSNTIAYWDFTFVLEGELVYWGNGERFRIKKGDAICFPPGTCRMREDSHAPVRYVSFNFTTEHPELLPFPLYMPDCITGTVRALLAAFPRSHLSRDSFDREKCMNMLNFILLELLEERQQPVSSPHVEKMLEYIGSNLHRPITLSQLSSHAGISREYACQLFRKETGLTVTQYVHRTSSIWPGT